MKIIAIMFSLFFAAQAFAEVKPAGALVATECGDNILDAPKDEYVYPTQVCIYNVTGTGEVLVGVKTFTDETYYFIDSITTINTQQEWSGVAAETEIVGPYVIYKGVVAGGETAKFTRDGDQFTGEFFMADLYDVFTTL